MHNKPRRRLFKAPPAPSLSCCDDGFHNDNQFTMDFKDCKSFFEFFQKKWKYSFFVAALGSKHPRPACCSVQVFWQIEICKTPQPDYSMNQPHDAEGAAVRLRQRSHA